MSLLGVVAARTKCQTLIHFYAKPLFVPASLLILDLIQSDYEPGIFIKLNYSNF